MAKRSKLSPKQLIFISEYLKDSNGTRAAIAAGYSKSNATSQAYFLLHKVEAVMAELNEQRKKLQASAQYSAEKAMKEAEDALLMAEITKNPMAMVKAVELKAKLTGLLIERHDVRQLSQLSISISGFSHGGNDDGNGTKKD